MKKKAFNAATSATFPRGNMAESATAPTTSPVSEGHRALLTFAGRRSATELAPILGVPERTVRRWLVGARPVWAHRERVGRLLGISWRAWDLFEAATR